MNRAPDDGTELAKIVSLITSLNSEVCHDAKPVVYNVIGCCHDDNPNVDNVEKW